MEEDVRDVSGAAMILIFHLNNQAVQMVLFQFK